MSISGLRRLRDRDEFAERQGYREEGRAAAVQETHDVPWWIERDAV